MKVALLTKRRLHWQSLTRTEMFYRKALTQNFEVIEVASPEAIRPLNDIAVVLDAYGNAQWLQSFHPPCPVLTCVHGGAVLHHAQLRVLMAHMWTSDVLIVNSHSDLAILQDLIGSGSGPALARVPLPVQSGTLARMDRLEAKEVIGVPGNTFVLGFVGRLIPQKNLHRFLRLIADLRHCMPQPLVGLIIGDFWRDYPVLPYSAETYHNYIETLIAGCGLSSGIIRLPGNLSDEDLSYCYSSMDLLIHPTMCIDENFGYVPIESMYCGTPVIGLAYGGLKDNIENDHNGMLIPTWLTPGGIRADFSQLADKCAMLLQNHAMRSTLSEYASISANTQFGEMACTKYVTAALLSSISLYTHQGVIPARPNGSLPAAESITPVLPATNPPWEYYMPAAAKYVSTLPPQPSRFADLRLPYDTAMTNSTLRLLDPTWPAEYKLSAEERDIVQGLMEQAMTGHSSLSEQARTREVWERLIIRGGLIAKCT